MNQHLSTQKYLKFNNVLNCSQYLSKILTEQNLLKRKLLIKKAKACVVNAISEIALNCLKGNVPLKTCDFQKLSKYKSVLRKLSKKSSVKARKNIINQRGGLLPIIIPAALLLIESIVKDILKDNV